MARAEPNPDTGTTGQAERRVLTRGERRDWLRLIRTENVGPSTFRDLLDHLGTAERALAALPDLSLRGGRTRPVRIATIEEAEAEIGRANALGARLVALGETGYPPMLANVDAPPPLLYVKGRMELADRPIVAMVGARNGSAIGQKLARILAGQLGAEGYVISSGFARGIDTAAHQASLPTGTIAVLAGGIDVIYPPENVDLHGEIGERGMLLTERPPGLQPRAQDFPRRNRIISGVAAGVVVVEAAKRSGSLITARFAGEQGREVFAVPGHPLDPRAEGTNRLIKDGACLVETADDIVCVLAPILGRLPKPHAGALAEPARVTAPHAADDVDSDDRKRIVAALSYSPVDIDELIRATGVPARMAHVVLLELDLAGRIERHGHQKVSLRAPRA